MIKAGFIAAVVAASLAAIPPAIAVDAVEIDEILAAIEAGDVCRDKNKTLFRRTLIVAGHIGDAARAPPSHGVVDFLTGAAVEAAMKAVGKTIHDVARCPTLAERLEESGTQSRRIRRLLNGPNMFNFEALKPHE